MRKVILMATMVLMSLVANAQNAAEARKILDKTASVVGRKGGASANFTVSSSKVGTVSGSIAIKGNMFHARTPQAIVWYNGKTQWSYMKSTNEVNISTPTEAQKMKMNPYTFLTMYKSGYNLSMTRKGKNYNVHLVAQNKTRSVQEVYLSINSSYTPTTVKMREGQTWTTIAITNFRAQSQPTSTFTFRVKDFPSAEIIDLR
jgi:Outer membrane lipoprotein carrier protein LolA.